MTSTNANNAPLGTRKLPSVVGANRFISEHAIAEHKQARGVTADGAGANEPYDPRTLYERLQEQKQMKDEEMDEAFRLAGSVKVVDEEEAEFLDGLLLEERQRRRDVEREVREGLRVFREEAMRARLALDAEDRPVEDHADLASASASTVSSSSHKFGAALASGPKIVPALGSTKAALKGVLVRKRGTEAKETKAPAVTKKLKGSAADKSRSPSPEKKNEIALVSGKASTASAVKAIAPASAIALVADYGSSDDDSA